MEDTACKEKCAYVKSGFCRTCEECPHYVESWWMEQGKDQPKLVRDCAPKRLVAQINSLENRLLGVQAATEEVRNETYLMKGHFAALVDASKAVIDEQKQIDTLSRELALEAREKLLLEGKG